MRKMMLLAALAAIAALMLAATPAMADDFDRHDFCRFFDCHDRFDFNHGFGDFDQDADSGDIDQSFDITGGGDNSNQTVGLQGVANTGNAQNQIGVTDFGDDFDNFDRNDFDRNDFDRNDFCDDFDGNDFCDDLRDFCDDFDRDGFCDNLFDRFHRFDRFNDGFGDFEFDDVGASIDLSPTNTTTSDQSVNQAATAVGK
jgi:hypothetical protein